MTNLIDIKALSALITAGVSITTWFCAKAILVRVDKLTDMGKNYEDVTKRTIGRFRMLVVSYEEEIEELNARCIDFVSYKEKIEELKARCIELENKNIILENKNCIIENARSEITHIRKSKVGGGGGVAAFFGKE